MSQNMIDEEALLGSDSGQSSLERAIDFMSDPTNGGCFDPRHYHSFRAVSFLFPLRTCAVCSQRLQSVIPFSSNQVVQCLSCRMLAHRTCALSKHTEWSEPCPVNYEAAQATTSKDTLSADVALEVNSDPATDDKLPVHSSNRQNESSRIQSELESDGRKGDKEDTAIFDRRSVFRIPLHSEGDCSIGGVSSSVRPGPRSTVSEGYIGSEGLGDRKYSKAHFPFLSASSLFLSRMDAPTQYHVGGNDGDNHAPTTIQRSQTWDGATPAKFDQQTPSLTTPQQAFVLNPSSPLLQTDENRAGGGSSKSMEWTAEGPPAHWATGESLAAMFPPKPSTESGGEERNDENSPLHFASHPFASVSRALQENILAHFRPVVQMILVKDGDMDMADTVQEAVSDTMENKEPRKPEEMLGDAAVPPDMPPTESEVEGLLEEAKTPGTDHRRLGIATVAGGIAGGVAGLVFAGPMGGVIGAKFGQTAGILGVVLEGSFTIGVITSGIAAGSHAGQQLQDKLDEKRVLALSGTGNNRGILLVRPSVQTDPAWARFCDEAKKSHHRVHHFSFLPSDSQTAKRERYEREIDIIKTDEIEIPTGDKVLLLVSRILNNKDSLPGHVYRQLIEKVRERAESRGPIANLVKEAKAMEMEKAENDSPEDDSSTSPIRARRQDAHAVIKYVTATLLELRPGFAASPTITEYTATSVESLVFGEIYDLVIEEIEAEFEDKENELLAKVAEFERSHTHSVGGISEYKTCISEAALEALHHLPEAHSAVDKLRYCVVFLEKISEFFSSDTNNRHKPMGADSLLKLVCQHILAAKVFGINAQVAFLDEFARDEHLLRGKEGYALVTLQASLHFLNASSDFNVDIFEQEDD